MNIASIKKGSSIYVSPQGESLQDLWRHFKDTGDVETRNKLVVRYEPWIRKIATAVHKGNPACDVEDLVNTGISDGLFEAMESFNLTLGVQFESFATARIRGAMIDFLRRDDFLPRSVREKIKRAESTGELETEKQEVHYMMQMRQKWDGADSSVTLPIEQLIKKENETKISDALKKLPKKQQKIITMRHFQGMTFAEIGKKLHLSEPTAFLRHDQAFKKLLRSFPDSTVFLEWKIFKQVVQSPDAKKAAIIKLAEALKNKKGDSTYYAISRSVGIRERTLKKIGAGAHFPRFENLQKMLDWLRISMSDFLLPCVPLPAARKSG